MQMVERCMRNVMHVVYMTEHCRIIRRDVGKLNYF